MAYGWPTHGERLTLGFDDRIMNVWWLKLKDNVVECCWLKLGRRSRIVARRLDLTVCQTPNQPKNIRYWNRTAERRGLPPFPYPGTCTVKIGRAHV